MDEKKPGLSGRRAREAAALRANLKRRKEQARERAKPVPATPRSGGHPKSPAEEHATSA